MAMAAASLRRAASRIGGRTLQRARSAAEQGRLFHTRARTLTADEKKDAAARLSHIQLKKEQLYDLIAECEKKYPKSSEDNFKLLQSLYEQVKPRLYDPLWLSSRRWALANFSIHLAGIIFLTDMASKAMIYSYKTSKYAHALQRVKKNTNLV